MITLDQVPAIPAMNTAAVNFLDLLADPTAARKLIAELKDAHDRATAAHTEAKQLQNDVMQKQHAHDEAVRVLETNRRAHSAFLADAGKKLDDRHSAADEREKALGERDTALDARETAVTAREAAVHAREHRLDASEKALAECVDEHQGRADRLAQKVALVLQSEEISLE